jgi:hypothetical protein
VRVEAEIQLCNCLHSFSDLSTYAAGLLQVGVLHSYKWVQLVLSRYCESCVVKQNSRGVGAHGVFRLLRWPEMTDRPPSSTLPKLDMITFVFTLHTPPMCMLVSLLGL